MLHDVLVPSRIGNYYLYAKRVLSFEVTPMMVQGVLFEYHGKSIQIKNKQSIILKDFSIQAQIGAIKKIASMIGKWDEIITTLSSSAVIFKELTLPFIGTDALKMVVPYEAESMLPFSLEDAVIDFMVTEEDLTKKQSTLLVAAVRKEDIEAHLALFEKAELQLHVITIDIFALFTLYKAGLCEVVKEPALELNQRKLSHSYFSKYFKKFSALFTKKTTPEKQAVMVESPAQFKPKQAELFIDIGFDVVRTLYIKDGILSAVRMVPMGISDIAQRISEQTGVPYYDVVQDILVSFGTQGFNETLHVEFKKLFEEITRTLLFFEKQEDQRYLKPYKIWFTGFGTHISGFEQSIHNYFGSVASLVDMNVVINRLKIKMILKKSDEVVSWMSLALGLFIHYEPNINFLKSIAQKSDDSLLNKQIIAVILMTLFSVGAVFWRSSTLLQEQESAYLASKKHCMKAVLQHMNLDLTGEKNMKTVVEKAEETLKREKALWFSFSRQQESCVLEYLQDLSIQIDRDATGLELRSMHLDFEKVIMTGSVKSFEALDVFEEELMSLKLLQPLEKPRELSFTGLTLKPKDDQKENA